MTTTTPGKALVHVPTVPVIVVAKPKVRENKQPHTRQSEALRASDRYERIVKRHNSALGSAWIIAWVRPDYAMLKTGAKGEWATICEHGTLKRVAKGAEAENAGRARTAWCGRCRKAAQA